MKNFIVKIEIVDKEKGVLISQDIFQLGRYYKEYDFPIVAGEYLFTGWDFEPSTKDKPDVKR